MNQLSEIEVEISSGKKKFKVEEDNGAFNLIESGSLVAVIKCIEGKWEITTGSYTGEDAEKIGRLITKQSI